ncbi:hypothetical protein TCAL_10903 [Tigriopus californicus]|uniref:RWD domain-containing protein n=1 Tax=Tigriopus californicus TaxID=6832 RepID=A0A553PJT4_TIGCA|nr:protein IMPACT-like [Tigriopus californicus]TRY77946.1 hypothetical protein TCAL_10903 [Tigriopus californicus]|eukprot:TCALIF_10903-PA protein Name:"Similar to Impact Protein IMPACT (Mus musculus)" AED:0.04 eAED:0.04 QI:120/1/1/1/1/1/3/171/280
MEDNRLQQEEEIEVLTSIYPQNITIHSTQQIDLRIQDANHEALLRVSFPPSYPSESPPNYELSAPFLSTEVKESLSQQLDALGQDKLGLPVVFTWVEAIREAVEQWTKTLVRSVENDDQVPLKTDSERILGDLEARRLAIECPEIFTGDPIEDRKSIFQAHFARVQNVEEVQAVLAKLKENRKIANAAHNMFAYRIKKTDGKLVIQDCDDDGENQAGSRMLHLLEIIGVENVVVVVSRWFGGIHLGPDRFKHINNATRNILEINGAISKDPNFTTTKCRK